MNTENELNNLKSEIKQLKFQIRLLINDTPTNHFLLAIRLIYFLFFIFQAQSQPK